MRIVSESDIKVIAKSTTKSQDGQKEYFKLGILQGSECGTISCPKEVFDSAIVEKKYRVEFVYNDTYKSFSFFRILRDLSVSAASTAK